MRNSPDRRAEVPAEYAYLEGRWLLLEH